MNYQDTETCAALMRAFAGECQAHTRYLLAAKEATAQNLPVLRQLFEFTAKQELTHAQLFAAELQKHGITQIGIAASYPLDPANDLLQILRAAQQNEHAEAGDVYVSFAEAAMRDEQQETSELFRQIAAIEAEHAARFGQFADWMEHGKLFREEKPTVWLCLNCGHIHEGTEPPQRCPVCGAVQGFAVRKAFAPLTA